MCSLAACCQVAIKVIKLSEEVQEVRRASVYRASTKHRAPVETEAYDVTAAASSTRSKSGSKSTKSVAIQEPAGGEQSRASTAASKARVARQSTVAGSVAAKAASELKFLCREIQLLQSLDHPALNKLFEYYISAPPSRPHAALPGVLGCIMSGSAVYAA